jgi:hypothetical protein
MRISVTVLTILAAVGMEALGLASEPSVDFTPDEQAVLARGFKWMEGRSDHGEKIFCRREVNFGPRVAEPLCGTGQQLKDLSKLTVRGLREGHFETLQGDGRRSAGPSGVRNGSDWDLCARGAPDVVIANCTHFIAHSKDRGDLGTALRNRASSYQSNGDLDDAIRDYTAALELGGVAAKLNAKTFGNRALAYAGKGDDSRALADYDQAIMLDPNLVTARINRADVYMKREDDARALADLLYRPWCASLAPSGSRRRHRGFFQRYSPECDRRDGLEGSGFCLPRQGRQHPGESRPRAGDPPRSEHGRGSPGSCADPPGKRQRRCRGRGACHRRATQPR